MLTEVWTGCVGLEWKPIVQQSNLCYNVLHEEGVQ